MRWLEKIYIYMVYVTIKMRRFREVVVHCPTSEILSRVTYPGRMRAERGKEADVWRGDTARGRECP